MKANEIMVGDWVLCNRKPYYIAEIGGMVRLENDKELLAALEDISPVPLTKTILKNNGFKLPEYDPEQEWYYEIGGANFIEADIRLHADEEGLHRWSVNIVSYEGATLEIGLNYVHELQHAARLMGISKDIVI